MKRAGFTLIEVLIATALASILSATLLMMFTNMNRIRGHVDRYVNLYQRATLIQAQFDRDLSGAFLPVEADMSQSRVADMMATQTLTSAPSGTAAAPQKNTQVQAQGPKKLEKPFFGDATLSELTFVTNNIMQRYWSTKLAALGTPQPRVARVIYQLIPDKKHADSFILMRTESPQIYLSDFEKSGARAYQIADGIKSVRMQYGVNVAIPEEKKNAPPGQGAQQPPTKFERKVVTEWKKIESHQPPWPLVPEWVVMELELWDVAYQRTHAYVFEFYIYPRFDKQKPHQRVVSQPMLPQLKIQPGPLPASRGGGVARSTGVITNGSLGFNQR